MSNSNHGQHEEAEDFEEVAFYTDGESDGEQKDESSEWPSSVGNELKQSIPWTKSFRTAYTYEETQSICDYLLNEIKSRHPSRKGRVAKRRVDIRTGAVWEKYKMYNQDKTLEKRGYFEKFMRRFHTFAGLSDQDRVDLYYALGLKVPEKMRQEYIDKFAVEFDSNGIITGSSKMTHWDLVHPDSDREEYGEVERILKNKKPQTWMRFSEKEDGLMWQYVLDDVNKNDDCAVNERYFWTQFKKKFVGKGISPQRLPETIRTRFQRSLAPNLHLMPFDIETKASLYQSCGIAVPNEYRRMLIDRTGVTIDEEGIVLDYPSRPSHLVLQSKPYYSCIGISSENRQSTLRQPLPRVKDTVPYTSEENKAIWEFLLKLAEKENGKKEKIQFKMNGHMLWKKFVKETETERTWQSLSQHFPDNLLDHILETDFDLKTKIEMFFITSTSLDDQTLEFIKNNTGLLLLDERNRIRYADGPNFEIGKKRANERQSSVTPSVEEEVLLDPNTPNSIRYPYVVPVPKRQYYSKPKRINKPKENMIEETLMHVEEQKPEILDTPSNETSEPVKPAESEATMGPDQNVPSTEGVQGRYNIKQTNETSKLDEEELDGLHEVSESMSSDEKKPDNLTLYSVDYDLMTGTSETKEEDYLAPEGIIMESSTRPSSTEMEMKMEQINYDEEYQMMEDDLFQDHLEDDLNNLSDDGEPSRKRARTDDEPGTSTSHQMIPELEEIFEDMEERIDDFTHQLRASGENLTHGERMPYFSRLEFLTRMFRQSAKIALFPKSNSNKKYTTTQPSNQNEDVSWSF